MPLRKLNPNTDSSIIALNLLEFIASDEDRMAAFLGASGLDVGDLRQRAADPQFLSGVMDYAFGNEQLLMEFSKQRRISLDEIARAYHRLCGPRD
jgi:hypothetical protein